MSWIRINREKGGRNQERNTDNRRSDQQNITNHHRLSCVGDQSACEESFAPSSVPGCVSFYKTGMFKILN